MTILRVEGLVKTYNRRRVVDGISMEIEPGEIVGLLGPNGAGKSTCFKMTCGLVRPDKGNVFLLDNNVTRLPLYQRSRLGMGYLPQQSSLFAKLSVQANLLGMMQLLGFTRKQQKQRCSELLEQFNIAHVRKSKAETLSGGERRRLEIARSLISNPKIIMLDEPFAAIDPVTVQNIQQVIRHLAESGIAILITDHAAREILQITDRTYVVNDGRILCSGSADEIINHEQVKQKYLGELQFFQTANPSSHSSNFSQTHGHNDPPIEAGTEVFVPNFSEASDRNSNQSDQRPKIVFSIHRPHNRDKTKISRTDLD